jgi:hypothetical protein
MPVGKRAGDQLAPGMVAVSGRALGEVARTGPPPGPASSCG